MLSEPPSSPSLLAIATTVHLALAALCNHRRAPRGGVSLWAAPALALAMAPWLLPSLIGVAAGLLAQLIWLAIAVATTPRPKRIDAPAVAATEPRRDRSAATSAFQQAPVLAAFDETSDIKTIRLVRPAGFDFLPGQFLTVRVQVDGKAYARCYSISSAPAASGYLEISVKRQGTGSGALHALARPGALLSIKKPNGRFVYPAGDDRPIVLLAGGVGITPLMSMLRHAIGAEPSRPVTLIYSARTAADFAFQDELTAIARRHAQARIIFAASRDTNARPDIYPGHIDEALLRATVPSLAQSIACLCGPTAMIDGLKTLLGSLGVPPGQIRYEIFSPSVAAAASPGPAGEAVQSAATAHEMQCTVSARKVPIGAGQTVLEAAEAAGIEVPSLCRAGVCGTCLTKVTAGAVDCGSTTLSEEDRRNGYVLACVATAQSACVVEL